MAASHNDISCLQFEQTNFCPMQKIMGKFVGRLRFGSLHNGQAINGCVTERFSENFGIQALYHKNLSIFYEDSCVGLHERNVENSRRQYDTLSAHIVVVIK
jgi:hypothetical protein